VKKEKTSNSKKGSKGELEAGLVRWNDLQTLFTYEKELRPDVVGGLEEKEKEKKKNAKIRNHHAYEGESKPTQKRKKKKRGV